MTFKIHILHSAYLFALGIAAGHSFCWSNGTGKASEIPFINWRKRFSGLKAWRLYGLIVIILEAHFIKFLDIWKNYEVA